MKTRKQITIILLLITLCTTVPIQAHIKVFTEPNSPYPLIKLLRHATNSIDIEVYLLTNRKILRTISSANKRGVKIKIILEKQPYGSASNNYSKHYLIRSGIPKRNIHFGNPKFIYTHEKAIVIDAKTNHAKAIIITFNLTYSAFYHNREYGVIDTNKTDINEIMQMFNYDWNHCSHCQKGIYKLVWSPINSRAKLLSMINDAKKSLLIESEELNDPQIIAALNRQANKNRMIKIILPATNQVKLNKRITANYFDPNKGDLYMHAKMIIADNKMAYIGSINFSSNSMNNNRELGIIFSNHKPIKKLISVFNHDWQNSSYTPNG